jgi:hypothetical protein
MTPIFDHTKRSRPPVQPCDAPSIDPAPEAIARLRGQPTPQIRDCLGRLSRGSIWAYSVSKGSGRTRPIRCAPQPGIRCRFHASCPAWLSARRGRVLVSLNGTLTLESLLGAVISAIRRGQQLLRVVIGHLG